MLYGELMIPLIPFMTGVNLQWSDLSSHADRVIYGSQYVGRAQDGSGLYTGKVVSESSMYFIKEMGQSGYTAGYTFEYLLSGGEQLTWQDHEGTSPAPDNAVIGGHSPEGDTFYVAGGGSNNEPGYFSPAINAALIPSGMSSSPVPNFKLLICTSCQISKLGTNHLIFCGEGWR